jgi:hypothetical protein
MFGAACGVAMLTILSGAGVKMGAGFFGRASLHHPPEGHWPTARPENTTA